MKIRPVGVELLLLLLLLPGTDGRTDGQRDGRDEANKSFSQIGERA